MDIIATSTSSDLHFQFYNSPDYWDLDDVCVTLSGGEVLRHLHQQGHLHVRPVAVRPAHFGITVTLMASTGSLTRTTPRWATANSPVFMTIST